MMRLWLHGPRALALSFAWLRDHDRREWARGMDPEPPTWRLDLWLRTRDQRAPRAHYAPPISGPAGSRLI